MTIPPHAGDEGLTVEEIDGLSMRAINYKLRSNFEMEIDVGLIIRLCNAARSWLEQQEGWSKVVRREGDNDPSTGAPTPSQPSGIAHDKNCAVFIPIYPAAKCDCGADESQFIEPSPSTPTASKSDCVKDPADDVDPEWCKTHSQSWHFCKHRPLIERLREPRISAGPTRCNPNNNELEAADALSSAEEENRKLREALEEARLREDDLLNAVFNKTLDQWIVNYDDMMEAIAKFRDAVVASRGKP